MSVDLSRLHRRSHLRTFGVTDRELRQARRAGTLTTIRRGAYLRTPDDRLDDPEARHALLAVAAWPQFAPGSVLSHCSAAVLHGLPVWSVPLDRVHVTRVRRTGGRIGRIAHLHSAPLADSDVVEIDGMAVTSVARTVIDLARTVPFEAGVTVADAALRTGLVDGESLLDSLDRAARRRGAPTARGVVAFADGRAESVGESRSRVAMARAGLPVPEPQWEVRYEGALIGRVDFGWPDRGAVGEFDGRVKYGRLLRPGQDPGEVVFAEKRREDRLRDHGLRVVRWYWDELRAFAPVEARIRQALG